jgi:hypothetical protein
MPLNGSRSSATVCSCENIAHVLRSLATCVDVLHEKGRRHDEGYILSLVETGLGAARYVAAQERVQRSGHA